MFVMSQPSQKRINIGGSGLGMDDIRRYAELSSAGLLLPSEGFAGNEAALYHVPERFEMEEPFHLMFMTCHDDSAESSLVIMQISPDQTVYVSERSRSQGFSQLNHRELHRHDFYELLYVIDGDIYQNIEHSRHYYPAGSCCLLNPNVYHTEESYGNQRIVFVGLRRDYLESLLSAARFFQREDSEAFRNLAAFLQLEDSASEFSGKASMDFIPLESEEWVHLHVHDVIEQLLRIMQDPEEGASLQTGALILKLLCLLFDPVHYRHSPIQFASSGEAQLFQEITGYLRENKGRPRRADLIRHFHYSGDYLYKIVKKFTGLSLNAYAVSICLEEAAAGLRETNAPVTELIRDLGFSNQTQFYRLFRQEYGMSPRAYRLQK